MAIEACSLAVTETGASSMKDMLKKFGSAKSEAFSYLNMKYFAFIRNVMVGRNGLTQAVLLNAFRQCGATNPISFLATGNLVFELDGCPQSNFVEGVTSALSLAVGFDEPIFLRSADELKMMQAQDPFAKAPIDEIYERCVTFFPDEALQLPMLPFGSTRRDVEIFAFTNGAAYSVTRLMGGRPGSAGALIEKIAKIKVTTRNWNTIERLLKKYS